MADNNSMPHHSRINTNWRSTAHNLSTQASLNGSAISRMPPTTTRANSFTLPLRPNLDGHASESRASVRTQNNMSATLPKNFRQPLTCFYWSHGGCSKTDDECYYAHWDTGHLAAAPVRVNDSSQPIAGRQALHALSTKEELKTREARVAAREDVLRNVEVELQIKSTNLHAAFNQFYDLVESLKDVSADSVHVLKRLREDLATKVNELMRDGTSVEGNNALADVDFAIERIREVGSQATDIKHSLRTTIDIEISNARDKAKVGDGAKGFSLKVENAGIIGLQTAISLLEAGYAVSIIAEHLPGDESTGYTSPWAGAQWRTHASAEEKEQCQWDIASYNHWLDIVKAEKWIANEAEKSGLAAYESRFYWASPSPESTNVPTSVWFARYVQDFRTVPSSSLPHGIHAGMSYTSVTINVPRHLQHLLQRAHILGARIIRAALPTSGGLAGALEAAERIALSPAKAAAHRTGGGKIDAFVNATGLLAKYLVPDGSMYPIRGQTVTVKGEVARVTTVEDSVKGEITYVIPRPGSGTTILGGTKEAGNWKVEPDKETTRAILERCRQWAPELLTGHSQEGEKRFEILSVQVGLRPGRKGGARVEVEDVEGKVVCHAYGHAGGGYQNSIGSAAKVIMLLDEYLAGQRLGKMMKL